MKVRAIFFLSVSFALLAFAPVSLAQVGLDTDNVLVLNIAPTHPSAFTKVSAELKSFTIDISRSEIEWSVDGVVKQTGQGSRLFQFETKGFGVPVELKVTAVTSDGRLFEKVRRFEPSGVELVWQANSYTPPFYKGKALFPYEGSGVAVALPFFMDETGSRIPARDLIFTWSENDEKVITASGPGKNIFPLESNIPIRPITIKVLVESNDQRLSAEKEITINPISPQILLYEDHPLYGTRLSRAIIDSIPLLQELNITAIPFFFGTARRARPYMKYEWGMNYKPIETESSESIVIRRTTNDSGRALLSIRALLPTKSLQETSRSIYITSDGSLGLFGESGDATLNQ